MKDYMKTGFEAYANELEDTLKKKKMSNVYKTQNIVGFPKDSVDSYYREEYASEVPMDNINQDLSDVSNDETLSVEETNSSNP